MGGSLTKQFSRESSVTLFVNRSTPVSAFEDNAFYVFTARPGLGTASRCPSSSSCRAASATSGTTTSTVAAEIGVPREDRILAWYVGLRRAVYQHLPERDLPPARSATSNLDALRHRRRRLHPAARVGHLRKQPVMRSALHPRRLGPARRSPGAGRAGDAPAYRVGPGDVLEVIVDGRSDLSRLPTVQTTGTVFLPRRRGRAGGGPDHRRRSRTGSRPSSRAEDLATPRVSVRVQGVPEPVRLGARRGRCTRGASPCAAGPGSSTRCSTPAASPRGPRGR